MHVGDSNGGPLQIINRRQEAAKAELLWRLFRNRGMTLEGDEEAGREGATSMKGKKTQHDRTSLGNELEVIIEDEATLEE